MYISCILPELPTDDKIILEELLTMPAEIWSTKLKRAISLLEDVVAWYPKNMPLEERHLVRKLDILVLTYACLSFFTKYLDVSALSKIFPS